MLEITTVSLLMSMNRRFRRRGNTLKPDLSIHLAGLLKYAGLTGYAIRMYSVYNQSGDIQRKGFAQPT